MVSVVRSVGQVAHIWEGTLLGRCVPPLLKRSGAAAEARRGVAFDWSGEPGECGAHLARMRARNGSLLSPHRRFLPPRRRVARL